MASDLFETLEYITLLNGDLVRGTNMHYEVIDGVLHFFVTYGLYVTKKDILEEDLMGELIHHGGVKTE